MTRVLKAACMAAVLSAVPAQADIEWRLADLTPFIAPLPDTKADTLYSVAPSPLSPTGVRVPFRLSHATGGTLYVPVELNGTVTVEMMLDSGAADVSITEEVFQRLGSGTTKLRQREYTMANGAVARRDLIMIKSLKVGDLVLEDIQASVGPGALLLGQTFLQRLSSWSIDNAEHVLILEPKTLATTTPGSVTTTTQPLPLPPPEPAPNDIINQRWPQPKADPEKPASPPASQRWRLFANPPTIRWFDPSPIPGPKELEPEPRRVRTVPITPEPPHAPIAGAGAYVVTVSSQRSQADAHASFRSLQSKYPRELGDREPIISRADLGPKGIYYRTSVGPFGTAADADQFCNDLKAHGGQCIVLKAYDGDRDASDGCHGDEACVKIAEATRCDAACQQRCKASRSDYATCFKEWGRPAPTIEFQRNQRR
jgi:clan AA aspartic protease (TIGR02281 family)